MNKLTSYSRPQTLWLVILRLLIGWHFLYEGLVKLFSSSWTAYPYLMDSRGFLADFFHTIAENAEFLAFSNYVNIYGLTLVGLGLILGCFSRYASIGGIVFLSLYYLSHIPYIRGKLYDAHRRLLSMDRQEPDRDRSIDGINIFSYLAHYRI